MKFALITVGLVGILTATFVAATASGDIIFVAAALSITSILAVILGLSQEF